MTPEQKPEKLPVSFLFFQGILWVLFVAGLLLVLVQLFAASQLVQSSRLLDRSLVSNVLALIMIGGLLKRWYWMWVVMMVINSIAILSMTIQLLRSPQAFSPIWIIVTVILTIALGVHKKFYR